MKITCVKLVGGGEGHTFDFPGPRLQRGYKSYVTITKPHSVSLCLAIMKQMEPTCSKGSFIFRYTYLLKFRLISVTTQHVFQYQNLLANGTGIPSTQIILPHTYKQYTLCFKSQLSADHSGISGAPSIITDCTPFIISAHFNSSLIGC